MPAENGERPRPARANAVRLAARLHCPKRQPSYATYFAEATKVKKATADRQADGTHRPAALRFRTPGVCLKPWNFKHIANPHIQAALREQDKRIKNF